MLPNICILNNPPKSLTSATGSGIYTGDVLKLASYTHRGRALSKRASKAVRLIGGGGVGVGLGGGGYGEGGGRGSSFIRTLN